MSHQQKLVVVSGAGSGIGRSTALGLAAAGWRVACLDIDELAATRTADEIKEDGGITRYFQVDIANTDSVEKVADEVRTSMGVPWALVNNAGWNQITRFLETGDEFWRKVLNINLLGPIAMSFHFGKQMVEAEAGGRIVNISSDSGRVGSSGESVYSGAKSGVIGFTKGLARELIRHGITVNCVSPGPTDTPLFATAPDSLMQALIKAIPAHRLAAPSEVMEAVKFFVAEENGYITGQTLSVSGGLTMI